jgi:hypothetical protein
MQREYEKIFNDLLELAQTDSDAKAIVQRWKIQRTSGAADKPQ